MILALYWMILRAIILIWKVRPPWIFVTVNMLTPKMGPGEIVPLLVTLSYDEAASYMETDSLFFNLPIPGEIQLWAEGYVLDHYRPLKRRNVSARLAERVRG
ncbi:MAG: hypothetical protein Ct9H300mP13_5970 [Gammaproteobacteria bacterium]|nr:MAG: hypothetical protein Ct9H300mP13_5970 [Gammaproteobacteria bacterium]